MAQVGNNENRFGGEFMVQDSDHMSGVTQSNGSANRIRQSDQSQSTSRQQGGDRKSDRQDQRRQAQ